MEAKPNLHTLIGGACEQSLCWGNQGGFLEEVPFELGSRDSRHGRGQPSRSRESRGQSPTEGVRVGFDEPEDKE